MFGEVVHKGHDGAAAFDEAAAGVHVGDVRELVVRDIQQPGQFRPVRRRLVEHDEELAVGQHGPGGVGLEEVVHILCDAGAAGPVFADTFPEGEQEVCAVLVLKQQVNFVDVDPGISSLLPVADDAVENAVQHHQHAHGQELAAQIPNVIAEDAGIGVHIGGLGKGIQAALGKQLNSQRHIPRLRLRLAQQFGVEILQGGHRAGVALADVLPVALGGAAVDDGLLLGGEFPGTHELLTQGQQELGLQHHRVLPVAVALLHVHGVDVVG